MTLRTAIDSDASKVFASTNDFAEVITYLPRHGPARQIKAVVFREALQDVTSGIIAPMFEVHVVNDSVLGIAGEELDIGGDKIRLPVRDGEDPVTKSIIYPPTQDRGMLVLQCQ